MISIYISNAEHTLEERTLDELPQLLAASNDDVSTLWVDLNDPTVEEEDRVLREIFDFHPLAIEDCQRERLDPERGDHLPKVEDFGRYLFAIINAIELVPTEARNDGAPEFEAHTRQ